jgi:hypothetical protein
MHARATRLALWSVFIVGPDDGWAVGEAGTILRWNGTDWSSWASPTTEDLYKVFMVSSGDGWAVGRSGTIIRWNGSGWILAHMLMPVVGVGPPAISASLGGNFTVDVKVTNVKNLYTYQFKLSWEPSILNVTNVTEGPFLNAEGTFSTAFTEEIWNEPDPFGVSGYVYVACTLLGEPATAAASGSGNLATIEFFAKEEGNTSLNLHDTMLINPFTEEMPHGTEDGYIIIPEFPSLVILPIFMIATLAVIVCRRRLRKGNVSVSIKNF